MKRRLFIFDLDGTLLDTIEDLGSACNQALSYAGYPIHPIDRYRMMVGGGIRLLVERALPSDARDEGNVERVLGHFVKYYSSACCVRTRPYPGIAGMLATLSDVGDLAVASNKFDSATQTIIGHYFRGVFDTVYGHREGHELKPSPEIVRTIMAERGFHADSTYMIGDSGTDVSTALNAGVHSIAVDWGFRPHCELEGLGAEFIASDAETLCRYLVEA